MTDEGFKLTPIDVRRWDFGSALRGYDRAMVDEFRERVAEELERLTRAHMDLEGKAKNFHEQLRAFRERDKALNDALISAQQLRAETREQAEREAQLILREARAEGERIIEAARGEARKIEVELTQLDKSRRAFLTQLRSMIERQLAELQAAEAGATPPGGVPAQPAAPDHSRQVPRDAARDEHDSGPRNVLKTPAWLEALKE
ncbi:MAG TPA: DivIVA domain-containing protein [Gemmatimonadaceae bacterium]|nr:DivIVA domain-containing protein [Gemmatimonadaceae bacterium]